MKYDVIIIGSRIAGAAAAILLARKGYRLLVVDRATFPSDTISTHIVWQRGVDRLMELGLGERLKEQNAPPLDTLEFDLGAFSLVAQTPAVGSAANAYAPRRKLLDTMLVEAAIEAGVAVREGFSVDEILMEGDRVTGISGHGKSGASVVDKAAVVIGADGVHSTLARAVGAQEYNAHPPLTCWYYSYWSGIANRRLRFFSREGQAFGCIPTNDGLACIAVAWPYNLFSRVKSDIESYYMAAFDTAPAFKEEVLDGRREERFYGTGHIPNYFRKPYGEGWALVGDSGYHKDPILAQGISDALRDASLLATALDDSFNGRATWEEAMGAYEASRNAAVDAIYEMNCEFASLHAPPEETQMLLAALRGNQADTNQFGGTITGAVPVSEFYAPANVHRILEEAHI